MPDIAVEILFRIAALLRRYWRWGVRVAVLWVTIGAIVPPPPRAILDEPQTVVTTKPMMCVHTRFTDEVNEWMIQRSMQLVREMGADTIVEFFPWAYFEPREDQYNWQRPDLVMRHAQNQGLKVIARMGFVPDWARPAKAGETTTE